jgi:hypothetical protein
MGKFVKYVQVNECIDVKDFGDYTHVNINYPRLRPFSKLGVFLVDTRAQGGLWISYDFGKNKWIVECDPLEPEDKVKDMIEVRRWVEPEDDDVEIQE